MTRRTTYCTTIGSTFRQILRDVFGAAGFRPPQGEIVATLLAGDDALVLMPIGGGKSLAAEPRALLR